VFGVLRLPLAANRSCFGAGRFERNSRAIQSQAALGAFLPYRDRSI
jgi:hypothetical protein